jgi:hypothetical protein
MKIDPTVKKETLFVSLVTLILSMLMQSVFLIIGKWDIGVLLGNLLGAGIGILNFFLLGLGVQKAVSSDETKAKEIMRGSHALRYALMIVLLAVGIVFSGVFNTITMLASFLFATIAVYMRMIFNKDKKTDAKASDENKAAEVVNSEEGDVVQ